MNDNDLTRIWRGREYIIFDLCQTKEEAESELREVRGAGYLAHQSITKDGAYQIWVTRREACQQQEKQLEG